MKKLSTWLSLLSLPALILAEGQLGNELEWIKLPDRDGQSITIQRTGDGTLVLTANESFFPVRGLKCEGTSDVPDVAELNKGSSFATITGWTDGSIAEWGLWTGTGTLDAKLSYTGDADFTILTSEGAEVPISKQSESIPIREGGFTTLRLIANRAAPGTTFERLTLSGTAATDAGVVRKRWRPAAAHTKFSSSKSPDNVRLWIMEMDAVPGELDFYCPVTTPFGYYGPTWKADGTVNTSFNFSLWSFKRGAPEPPVEQLSHLTAIGDPDALFGGFDHEGTGVKIRGWEPLEGRQGQRQTLALRVEPGDKYDTYYSYFYAADEKRWRLFGAGKKWNKSKPLSSLWVGSFVEVPGPSPVQRTGPYLRTMRYRGWIMDENEKWYPLDQMQNGNVDKESGLTHTNRGVTDDGWFFLETGGWTFREPPFKGKTVVIPSGKAPPKVDYLDPGDLEYLKTLPCEIVITNLERRDGKARVSYAIRGAGGKAEATLYWGDDEGLTFTDRWDQSAAIPGNSDGEYQHVFDIDPDHPLHTRVFLKNEQGQFWSANSKVAQP